LVFVSFDAEELCLRGSRAFYKKHGGEFQETKTWNFNLECPYCLGDLKFLTTDINGLLQLSSKLANKLNDIAHELGYSQSRALSLMPLAGGTDAAEAAKVGIEATCMAGLPYGPLEARGTKISYHTTRDTVDSMEPEMVECTFRVFLRFVDELEAGTFA
jgi:Zn-dependent M28 family amino/carboxypeptidase